MAFLNRMRRMFAGAAKPAPPAAAPPLGPASRNAGAAPAGFTPAASGPGCSAAAESTDDAPPACPTDLDRRFSAFMLAIAQCRPGAAEPPERSVLQRLEALGHDAADVERLPRLPSVLPRLMRLARRDDVAPRELVDHLSHDPALVGEVVRLANSPRYRTARGIDNLQAAVIAIGQRGMNQLVTSVAMRPIFNLPQGRFSRAAGTRLWALAERGAHACAFLRGDAADSFNAYLAGLVANVGWIAALRVLDQSELAVQGADTAGFHDELPLVAAGLSARIARHWAFPAEVCQALDGRAVNAQATRADALGFALRAADRVSKWHLLEPGIDAARFGANPAIESRGYLELGRTFGA